MNAVEPDHPRAEAGEGPRISVLVPCFNEATIIRSSYEKLKEACRAQPVTYEIIFGDDGSTDGTLESLRRLAGEDAAVKVASHYPNRGAGFTYRQMYGIAAGEIIFQMDADMAMPPERTLPELLESLEGADMAVGSRYAGIRADYPLKRRIFSRGYTLLTRLLFHLDITDTQTGFMAFYRKILADVDLRSDGFELLTELVAQANACGYRVVEVGLPWRHDTTSGETDVWKESVKMLVGTIRVKRRFNRFLKGRLPATAAERTKTYDRKADHD
ncbi:MAG TPA: glycosyltransferase family 2 protein [Actinobacteria bacterium]|nr:glycosyltransferase family 2 protein [Actinomycetota bacterium]